MQPNGYEKYLGGTFQESMFLSPVTKEELNTIISSFGYTASGWDDIAPRSINFVKEMIHGNCPRTNKNRQSITNI